MVIISHDKNLCNDDDLSDNIEDFCSDEPTAALLRMYSVLIGKMIPFYQMRIFRNAYIMLLLNGAGDFETSDYQHPAMYLYFILFTLFGVIVLTNLLIAVVGDAYVDAMAKSKGIFGRSRVLFLSENLALEKFLLPGTKLFEGITISQAKHVRDLMVRLLRWTVLGSLCVSPFLVMYDYVDTTVHDIHRMVTVTGFNISFALKLILYVIFIMLLGVSLWTIIQLLIGSSVEGIYSCYKAPIIKPIDRLNTRLLRFLRKTVFREVTLDEDVDKEKIEMMEHIDSTVQTSLLQSERNIGLRIKALEANLKEQNESLVLEMTKPNDGTKYRGRLF